MRRRISAAEEGLRRLAIVADGLARAAAIDPGTADSIVADLEVALAARARIEPYRLGMREMHRLRERRGPGPPAGPYLAVPAGTLIPTSPESGLVEVRLFTLVLAPDRAVLTVAGRLSDENLRSQHLDPWPLFGGQRPAARDDRGNRYELHEDSGWSDERELGRRPAPDPGPARRDPVAGADHEPGLAPGPAGPGRLRRGPRAARSRRTHSRRSARPSAWSTRRPWRLLALAAAGGHALPWHDLSAVADVVTALDAVGALEPARAAVGRLVTLAGRLGVAIPPALSAAAPPGPAELPEAWRNVLENRDRRDGPLGAAPAAAVLPELDGTRFVLAGLRSDEAGADLHVMAWGAQVLPHFLLTPRSGRWSWSARDDRGRWHVAEEGNSSSGDEHADLHAAAGPAAASAGHLAGGDGDRPVRPGDGHGAAGLAGVTVSAAAGRRTAVVGAAAARAGAGLLRGRHAPAALGPGPAHRR